VIPSVALLPASLSRVLISGYRNRRPIRPGPVGQPVLSKPFGLRFLPDGRLYCVACEGVIAFNFETGDYLNAVVWLPGLPGQAVIFFPE